MEQYDIIKVILKRNNIELLPKNHLDNRIKELGRFPKERITYRKAVDDILILEYDSIYDLDDDIEYVNNLRIGFSEEVGVFCRVDTIRSVDYRENSELFFSANRFFIYDRKLIGWKRNGYEYICYKICDIPDDVYDVLKLIYSDFSWFSTADAESIIAACK